MSLPLSSLAFIVLSSHMTRRTDLTHRSYVQQPIQLAISTNIQPDGGTSPARAVNRGDAAFVSKCGRITAVADIAGVAYDTGCGYLRNAVNAQKVRSKLTHNRANVMLSCFDFGAEESDALASIVELVKYCTEGDIDRP